MSDAVTRLNQALEGRYQIERELGESGMAIALPGGHGIPRMTVIMTVSLPV